MTQKKHSNANTNPFPITKLDELIRPFVVPHDRTISLSKDYDPAYKPDHLHKSHAKGQLKEGIQALKEYQDMLYAQNKYAVLIIFQAMDAAGKDSTIKHVMSGINPQGCQVFSFKKPSTEELNHDYLWRCSKDLPERGRIGIFNRSYYEEILVTRVHPEILEQRPLGLSVVDSNIWKRRFQEINNFEKHLVNNGTIILKFFLNVSKEEQRERFIERINRPEKNWKFSINDVNERGFWSDYMSVYEDMFNHTSTINRALHTPPKAGPQKPAAA